MAAQCSVEPGGWPHIMSATRGRQVSRCFEVYRMFLFLADECDWVQNASTVRRSKADAGTVAQLFWM